MKKISAFALSLFLFCAYAMQLSAQIDRSKAPLPKPAPTIELGKYESFTLENGLKVFVVENHKLPQVSFYLSFDMPTFAEGDKVGATDLMGALLRAGTSNRSKDQLDEEIDFIGASLNAGADAVFGGALTKNADKLMELMADVVLNPTFPEEELEKEKSKTLSGLQATATNAEAIMGNVKKVVNYGTAHPYGEVMTEEHVKNISAADLKKLHQTYFKPNIAHLAIVGDIDLKTAKALVEKYLKGWQKGEVARPTFQTPKRPENTRVVVADKAGAVQTVLSISYPIEYSLKSDDYFAAILMAEILGGSGFGGRMMQNLRETKAYTYGAYNSLASDRLIGSYSAGASVRNEVTDSAVVEFLHEMEKIVKDGISEDELNRVKSTRSGAFARSLESPFTVALQAINTEKYGLPKDFYINYLKNLNAVTVEQANAAAKKYILPKNANIFAVGKASLLKEKLARFGEILEYDAFGKPVVAADMSAAGDMTAEGVIEKYIKAIGGREKLESIESRTMEMNAKIQGMDMAMKMITTKDGKSFSSQSVMGMQMKQVYNGTKALVDTPQGKQIIEDETELAKMKESSVLFPQLYYAKNGTKLTLKGVTKVEGQDAYEVEVKTPAGSEGVEYYSTETGLLIQSVDADKGTVFSDYKEVEGVKIPHKARMGTQMGMMEATITKIKFNEKVDAKIFNIK
ncbi:insulinase family protein [Hugenholtzia roseola]|uniref:insulinase family protein n=1 Tax=Hugenholtzia roseola TaxID=1002 RepID=UPI00047BD9F7|nr:insulinase family protein [Hugenholtzia roseola]